MPADGATSDRPFRSRSARFAYSPELPGCFSQGRNRQEAMENIKETVDLFLETLDPEERSQFLSKRVSTSSVEVVAA